MRGTARRLAGGLGALGLGMAVLGGCAGGAAAPPVATVTVPAPTTASPSPVVGAAAGSDAGTTGATLVPPNCPTGQLTLRLGDGGGAAGSLVRPLVFTNAGSSTCRLRGFPGVSFVAGDDGHQVGPAAVEDGPRAGQVDLAPGQSAHVEMRIANHLNYDDATCAPTAVRGFRVYPPGDTAAAYVPAPDTACANVALLHVETMEPGAS